MILWNSFMFILVTLVYVGLSYSEPLNLRTVSRKTRAEVDLEVDPRINYGKSCDITKYPWNVAILYVNATASFCAGALITNQVVVSAAHCFPEANVTNTKVDNLVVALGVTNVAKDKGVRGKIAELHIHQKYFEQMYRDDIALLKLWAPVQYNDRIKPIPLPHPKYNFYGCVATATGWGDMKGVASPVVHLQEVDLPIVERNNCKLTIAKTHPHKARLVSEGNICAGGVDERDTCLGDSGGPLFVEDTAGYTLIGIVSFGVDPCGTEGMPGVYTNVIYYLDWIHEHIKEVMKST